MLAVRQLTCKLPLGVSDEGETEQDSETSTSEAKEKPTTEGSIEKPSAEIKHDKNES